MATSRNQRDVTLTLSVDTLNEDSIDKLRQSVLQLAKQGGDAAPEFQQLADQIDRIGEQSAALDTFRELGQESERLAREQDAAATSTERLAGELRQAQQATNAAATAQREAANAAVAADAAVRGARAGIQQLRAEYNAGLKSTDEYKAGMVELTRTVTEQSAQLPELRAARTAATRAAQEATTAEARLEGQYARSLTAQRGAEAAQRANAESMQEAATAARNLGVATESVQGSSGALLESLNQIGARAAIAAERTRELAESDRLLAIEQRSLLDLQQRGADALQAEVVAQREAARGAEEYAEKIRQAALAQREWQAEADALVTAAENTARLRREAEQLVETQRRLANQRVFEQTADDAAKLRQAAEYVRFWEQALGEADTQARQTAESAETAAKRIANAFDTVGVRSAQELQQEITEVRAAMAVLASSADSAGTQLAGAFAAGERKVRDLERELRSVNGTLTMADKAARLFSNSMGQITAGNLLADAIGALVEKVKEMGRAFISSIVEMDQMRRGLNAVYKDAGLVATQIDFVRKTASDAGVSFSSLSKEFVRFSASMTSAGVPVAESNALFKELVSASASLGQSAEDTAGSLNALGQMASKGTVSMEELRQQLGDRLPGAFGLVAQGLGITQAQLVKLVESGNLAARDLFPALTRALGTMRGETDGLVPTYERLKGALTQTAQAAGDAGWTQILTMGLRGVGVAAASLLLPLQGLFETMGLLLRGAGVLVGGLMTLTNPLEALRDLVGDAAKRQSDLTDAFNRMIGIGGDTEASLNTTANATAQVASSTQTAIEATQGLGRAAQLAAVSTEIAGNNAFDASAKYVQFQLASATLAKAQEEESLALAKSAKAVKTKGDSLVDLARLQGEESVILETSRKAAEDYAVAAEKLAVSKRTELALQQQTLAALEADQKQRGLSADAVKVQREALDNKLLSATAEAQQATESAVAAEREAMGRRLASQAYQDNSARVNEYREAMGLAGGAVQAMEALQRVGLATDDQVLAARTRLAEVTVLYKDSLGDSAQALQLETLAKTAALAMDTADYSARAQSAEILARQARLLGDTAQANYYEIEAKKANVEITRIKYELMMLEANAAIAALQLERDAIVVTDSVTAAKARELELRIQMAQVKLREAGAGADVVRALENEIVALRNNQNAREGGRRGIESDTGSRQGNVGAINQQISALQRLQEVQDRYSKPTSNRDSGLTSDGLKANKDGSAAGTFGNTLPTDVANQIVAKLRNGTLAAGDLSAAQTAMQQANNSRQWLNATMANSPGAVSTEAQTSATALYNGARAALQEVQYLVQQQELQSRAKPAATSSQSTAASGGNKTITVKLQNGNSTETVTVGSQAEADALIRALQRASLTAS